MPSTLGKNLILCFTKIKDHASSQTCVQEDDGLPRSISNTTSMLFKNYNSLYNFSVDCTTNSKSLSHTFSSDYDLPSPEADDETTAPDLATVFASQRFFFSSPGRSNSIIDSSTSSSMSSSSSSSRGNPQESDTLVGGSIAIPTFSPDPYMDFRRSMQEMVEARDLMDVRANWDYLHELLMCYLDLNPKSTHKFIIGAFSDLLVTLMTSPVERGGRKLEFTEGGCKISQG